MALDHGTLNVPLSKRGNIDTQIDAHKSSRASAVKALEKAHKAELVRLRPLAKEAVRSAPQGMLERVAAASKTTAKAVRKALESDAYWRPAYVLGMLNIEVSKWPPSPAPSH